MMIYRLVSLFNQVLYLYSLVLFVYALMSWFPGAYNTGLGRFLRKICDPYLEIFRRLPLQFGGIDFSFILAIIVLNGARSILTRLFLGFVY